MLRIQVNNKEKGFGSFDERKNLITINKKRHKGNKAELLDTIVHETMHAKHRKMKERTVRKVTATMIENMSPEEKRKHLAKVRMKAINQKAGAIKRKYKMGAVEDKPGELITKMNEGFKSGVQALI